MRIYLSETLFWIALVQCILLAPVLHWATRIVPRRLLSLPMWAILMSVVVPAVGGALFFLPLFVSGNFPLPCCDRYEPYRHGIWTGLALVIAARLYLHIRSWFV